MAEQRNPGTDSFGGTQAADASIPGNVKMVDLAYLFYRLIDSWKIIVCVAAAFALIVGLYTVYFVTPMYRATAIIYVLSPESVLNFSSLQLGTALTSDYIKIFDMWEVHEEVISNLNLNYTYDQMRDRLSVTNSSGTRMLDISFTSPSPAEAAAVANEYAKVASDYIQQTMSTDRPNRMSQALEPVNPVSPSRAKNVLGGFIFGGVLSIIILAIRFLTDDKIKTAEEIRDCTGLVTLAVVPVDDNISPGTEKARKQGRKQE
ncbi:MAG: hypothetical protein IKH57_05365 [Clostridia bacterium]|nr:hypothetical protein [Clostridia bacterium]